MSWGKLLFGNVTYSILLSHFMYLPALALAYCILRKWLKSSYALLAVTLVLSLPMLSFQTMVDEKIDLGFLFISLAIVYLLIQWKIPEKGPKWKSLIGGKYWYPAVLIGLMLGFAFTIKYTTIFLLAGLIGLWSYRLGKCLLFLASSAFVLGALFLSGFHSWGNLPLEPGEASVTGIVLLLLGGGGSIYLLTQKRKLLPMAWAVVLLLGSFSIYFSPWAGKHLAERTEFSISGVLYGKPDRIAISVAPEYLSELFNSAPSKVGTPKSPVLLTQNDQAPSGEKAEETEREEETGLIGNAQREELQRYLGYEEGIWRYLTIPFDLTFNINVPGLRHQEIGYFWLMLLPFLFLLGGGRKNTLLNLAKIAGVLFLLTGWFWSLSEASPGPDYMSEASAYQATFYQAVPDWQGSSFQVFWQKLQVPFLQVSKPLSGLFATMANWPGAVFFTILFLLYAAIVYGLRKRFSKWETTQQEVSIFLVNYVLLWLLLANSISWYAMLIWVLLPGLILFYLQKPTALWGDNTRKVVKYLLGAAITLQLVTNTLVVSSSSQPNQPAAQVFNWPMVSYMTSIDKDRDEILQQFDYYSSEITQILNRSDDARIYRVNSYLQSHIERNNLRVFEDNQLIRFDRILSLTQNNEDFIRILKDNDFEYILYDLNSPSLDRTPERSLQQKCEIFIRMLVSSNLVELVSTDNFVEDPTLTQPVRLPDGNSAMVRPGLLGKTLYRGRIALFRIK
jgi:hypothetical protein